MTIVVQISFSRDEEKLIWEARKTAGSDVALNEFVKSLVMSKVKEMVDSEKGVKA